MQEFNEEGVSFFGRSVASLGELDALEKRYARIFAVCAVAVFALLAVAGAGAVTLTQSAPMMDALRAYGPALG